MSIVERHGGKMRTRGEPEKVDYALPVNASREVREWLAKHACLEIAGAFVGELPGGRVFGSGVVLSPDGSLIARDVSEDFGRTLHEHWLLGFGEMRPPKKRRGAVGVVATNRSAGYSHWLLEELPRLLDAPVAECDALVANITLPSAAEVIAQLHPQKEILPVTRPLHLQCERLIVPSLCAPAGFPTSRSTELVRGLVARRVTAGGGRDWGERIFVSRSKARRRRLVNEAALWARLEEAGFRRVFLEDMTWAEQIACFRGARVVIGPHGAGMANLLFCEPGTRVVEIFNRAYVNPCFWHLAAVRQLDYRPLVVAGDTPIGQELGANRHDIEADVNAVLGTLAAM